MVSMPTPKKILIIDPNTEWPTKICKLLNPEENNFQVATASCARSFQNKCFLYLPHLTILRQIKNYWFGAIAPNQ